MEVDIKKLLEQIEDVSQEQKMLEKKLNSITEKLNINEQQLNESSNFLLSKSKKLFTNQSEDALTNERKLFSSGPVAILIWLPAKNLTD